jgi:hypothetical protein
MRIEKTTEIIFETEEMLILNRRTRRLAPAWCEACGAEAELVSPEVAAAVADVSARTVYGWVEVGRVHFVETPERALLICLRSLRPDLRRAI